MIPAIISIASMAVAIVAMLIARNSYHRTRRLIAQAAQARTHRPIGQLVADRPQCAGGPPGVQCPMPAGHRGEHAILASQLTRAGYVRPPF